jgi:hypothetical protein
MSNERKLSRLGYFLFIVFLVVTVLVSGQGSSPRRYAQAQDGASEEISLCAGHGFLVEGQNWEVEGGVGGIRDTTAEPLGPDEAVDYSTILSSQISVSSIYKPVAILVIDDFQTPVGNLSHGDYVYTVADELLKSFGIPVLYAPPETADSSILLDKLDVAPGYRTNLIVQGINTKLAQYQASGYSRVVLNMSFVLMPCEYTFQGTDKKFDFFTFIDTYQARTQEGENYSLVEYLQQYFTDPVREGRVQELLNYDVAAEFESLHKQLQQSPPEGIDKIIPVAAAGNSGWSVPFKPGLWLEVLSASSTQADTATLSIFSNSGEIAAPGEWYEFPANDEAVAGTSFAAPFVSVFFALLEAKDSGNQCDEWELSVDPASNPPTFSNPYFAGTEQVVCP